ncbi:MAG: protoporphyrinogen oxidase HemJ [Mariprofundales bacterium]
MLWYKSFHIIFLVAWFAGLFYLPRLLAYHAATANKDIYAQFVLMERKLYGIIMMPAMILTLVFGFLLAGQMHDLLRDAWWFHAKMSLVVILVVFHFYCGAMVKRFANNTNTHSERFYRIFNEVPTLILIAAVLLIVIQP